MFQPGQATLLLDKRLKILNGLVPSASDLSQSAEEIRNWVLEMVALSVEGCKTGHAVGPEGEALVDMVMAYHGFDELYTKLVAFPIDRPPPPASLVPDCNMAMWRCRQQCMLYQGAPNPLLTNDIVWSQLSRA